VLKTPHLALDHIEESWLATVRRRTDRMLAIVLLTDIVSSTEQAGQLDDRR